MVVISASICTKSGKILMARQFVAINRLKLEEYMANFPKLLDSGKFQKSFWLLWRQIMHAYWDWINQVCIRANWDTLPSVNYKQELQHYRRLRSSETTEPSCSSLMQLKYRGKDRHEKSFRLDTELRWRDNPGLQRIGITIVTWCLPRDGFYWWEDLQDSVGCPRGRG